MSKSKSNTGVGLIDKVVDTVSSVDIGGVHDKMFEAGKNKETAFKNMMYAMKTGDYSNMIQGGMKTSGPGGQRTMRIAGIDPNKMETSIGRDERRAQEKSDQEAADQKIYDNDARIGRLSNILMSSARARMISP